LKRKGDMGEKKASREFNAVPSVCKIVKTLPPEDKASRPRNTASKRGIKHGREVIGRGETFYLSNGQGLHRDDLKAIHLLQICSPEILEVAGQKAHGLGML
jgi:hypothetical protein